MKTKCQCGHILGVKCDQTREKMDMIEYEYMPEYLKETHKTAGNWGEYPHNGAQRILITQECNETLQNI